MSIEEIEKTKESGYLQLSTKGKLSHYSMVFFTGIIGLFLSFLFIIRPTIELGLAMVGIIILTILFFYMQRNRLKMVVIETILSEKDIYDIIKVTAEELEWYPTLIQDNIFLGQTHPNPFKSGSWGEQITILINKHTILANSICDTEKQDSVVSFGRNKRNIRTLKNNIEEKEKNWIR